MKSEKCECPTKGRLQAGMAKEYDTEKELPFVNHKPNECECTNELKQYFRKGKKIWLCSCCNMSGDEEIKR